MKYIKQVIILAAICFVGEMVHNLIPLPIPASIYGFIILFVLLETGLLKTDDIREVSSFLLDIMILMFIPAGVGLMEYWGSIKSIWWQLLIVIAVVSIVVFGVSGLVTQAVSRAGRRKETEAER